MFTRVQKWYKNTQLSMDRSSRFLLLYFLNYIPNVLSTDFQLKNLLLAFSVHQVGHRVPQEALATRFYIQLLILQISEGGRSDNPSAEQHKANSFTLLTQIADGKESHIFRASANSHRRVCPLVRCQESHGFNGGKCVHSPRCDHFPRRTFLYAAMGFSGYPQPPSFQMVSGPVLKLQLVSQLMLGPGGALGQNDDFHIPRNFTLCLRERRQKEN